MDWLWWTLGLGCGGLVVLAVLAIIWFIIVDSGKKRRTLYEGEHTFGWLVQANVKLFEDGLLDLPALVLISPDGATSNDKVFMTDLAERIMELKEVDPDDCGDKDDVLVAELMIDEAYIEGKRDKLPRGFAEGRDVYLAHLFVYRDHLPGKRLKRRRIPCAIIWEDPSSLICTRPTTPGDQRHGEDEDEE